MVRAVSTECVNVKLRRPFIFTNPWWVVFGAMVGMIVGNTPVITFSFGQFLKPVADEFGWSRATAASALSVSQFVGAFSMPFLGKLIDRLGIRRVTLFFVVVFSMTMALISQIPASPALFALLYGVCGFAGAGRGPLSYTKAIAGWFQTRRGLALGIAMSGLAIGAAVIPGTAQLLIKNFGWRGAYIGLGVITFAFAFPTVAIFIREPERAVSQEPLSSGAKAAAAVRDLSVGLQILRLRTFWVLVTAVFLISMSVDGTIVHVVPMLTDRGISLQFATLLVSLSSLSLIVATVASGFLLDRFPVSSVCAGFFLAPCLGIILLSAEATSAGLAVGSFCLGLGKGAEGVVVPFLVGRYFGLPRFGETIGYVIAASVFGFGLGPWLMALCYDLRHSYALVLTAFCLALVIGALLIAFLESHVRREPSVIGVGNG